MPPNVVAQEIANEENTESNEASFEQQVAELCIGSLTVETDCVDCANAAILEPNVDVIVDAQKSIQIADGDNDNDEAEQVSARSIEAFFDEESHSADFGGYADGNRSDPTDEVLLQYGDIDNDANANAEDPLTIKLEKVEVFIKEIENVVVLNEFHADLIDDDLTVYYENAASFQPFQSFLQLKQHDEFSGSLPFQAMVGFSIFISIFLQNKNLTTDIFSRTIKIASITWDLIKCIFQHNILNRCENQISRQMFPFLIAISYKL